MAHAQHVHSASSDVVDRGRSALESAERAALEVRRQAREGASVDRATVREAATRAVARIDAVEAEIRQSLQQLRDDVAAATGADEPTPAPRRRARRSLRRRAKVTRCDVCGRAAGHERIAGWEQTRGTTLCPGCRGAGWRVAERAGVPYRPRSA
jgi:hypothetical protein